MNALRTAVNFLTVIPWRGRTEQTPASLGEAGVWFPLVGALIGLISGLVYYGLSFVLPPLAAAVFATGVWLGLSGGLHLDGLADCCDGMLAAVSRERRLEIMKDPRLGTFGGLGLMLAVLLKISLVSGLDPARALLALPLAAAAGRWLLLPSAFQPLARPGGMGAAFAASVNRTSLLIGALWLLPLIAFNGWRGLAGLLLALAAAGMIWRAARHRLGGVTGDVFGLVVETGELCALLAFNLRWAL
ncbi:MAG: adenosylcobinamide-GDP ribazoletransferase [Chloroflexota bacterium]